MRRPDGEGQMASGLGVPESRAGGLLCAVGGEFRPAFAGSGHVFPPRLTAVDPPARVVGGTEPRTARHPGRVHGYGGGRTGRTRAAPEASIRSAGDYLNMVLRNGDIGVSARIVHIAQISWSPLGSRWQERNGLLRIVDHFAVALQRGGSSTAHGSTAPTLYTSSRASLRGCSEAPAASTTSWVAATVQRTSRRSHTGGPPTRVPDDGPIFAHEIGHGLGCSPRSGERRFTAASLSGPTPSATAISIASRTSGRS